MVRIYSAIFRNCLSVACFDGSAGSHGHGRYVSLSWRAPLAGSAPPGVSSGSCQCATHLLASHPPITALCRDPVHRVRSAPRPGLRPFLCPQGGEHGIDVVVGIGAAADCVDSALVQTNPALYNASSLPQARSASDLL